MANSLKKGQRYSQLDSFRIFLKDNDSLARFFKNKENSKFQNSRCQYLYCDDMLKIIVSSFNWAATKEGIEYWFNIHKFWEFMYGKI